MQNLTDNQENIVKNVQSNRIMQVKSGLAFINSHNGFRKGKMHTFMAGSGVGKSTLIRTIVNDLVMHNAIDGLDINLWLSEERIIDFQSEFFKGQKIDDSFAMVDLNSELDIGMKNVNKLRFFEAVAKSKVFIFDNLTTSVLYNDKRPSEQSTFLGELKEVISKNNIICILVVHADGKQNENKNAMPSMNDVRGSKSITNLSEFFYIIQSIFLNNTKFNFITIKKHRGQNLEGAFYGLPYLKDTSTYGRDFLMNFNEINDLFKKSNKVTS